MILMFYLFVALTLACVLGVLIVPTLTRPTSEETRLIEWVNTGREATPRPSALRLLQTQISEVVKACKAMVGVSEDNELISRLARAGFRGQEAAELYIAGRFLAPLLCILIASFATDSGLSAVLVGGGIGYVLPDMWLRSQIRRRRERLRKGFPDMVDLLVICMDAGLGLDQALLRVGNELSIAQPEISEELAQLNLEQRAGKPRIEAWQSMALRTDIPEVRAFTGMLVQTYRFGTPILGALGRLSNDMRLKRRQHAEEMAAKTKIKILFPLALFIFPCIFIVLLAPALISIGKTMGSLGK